MASTSKKTSSSTAKNTTTSKVTPNQEPAKKAPASKATASKASTSRTNPRKPAAVEGIIQSVVFTQNELDQELLEAIEQELEEAEFTDFDELCKEALYQFLWQDEASQSDDSGPSEEPDSIPTEFSQTQLTQLQNQFAKFEQSLVAKNATHAKQLGQQIGQQVGQQVGQHIRQILPSIEQMEARLTDQLDALQAQLDSLQQLIVVAPLASLPDPIEAVEPEVEPEIEPEIEPEVEPEIEPEVEPEVEPEIEPVETLKTLAKKIPTERDPFLDRLSALLEDF